MPYLIDGHNLIPKMGISLSDPDDEQKLLERLGDFSRLSRKKVEVFFDQAPAGYAGSRRQGNLSAHFVRQGTTADDAILARLKKLGPAAANWTVVSSDAHVRAGARACRAAVLSAEEFAVLAERVQGRAVSDGTPAGLSEEEIEEWLDIFR